MINSVELKEAERAEKVERVAVLLTRAQPFTLGHEALVKQMLKEVGNVCIVIGSADKFGTERNPFKSDLRLYWVVNILKKYTERADEEFTFEHGYDRVFRSKHLTIFALDDWESEDNTTTIHQWGSYLYYNIVSKIKQRHLVFYYSDGKDKIQSWFSDELKNYVEYKIQTRDDVYSGVSATKVRELLVKSYMEHKEDEKLYNMLSNTYLRLGFTLFGLGQLIKGE